MRAYLGDLGHLCVIISFIFSILATISFGKATVSIDEPKKDSWLRFARGIFFIHSLAVFGIVAALFTIISQHYYEYHYAWSHSSNNLPSEYMISCFWEGQEGSFLLWTFWNVLLGLILIKVNKTWEAPVMTIFCLVQLFLCSMILGIVIPGLDFKVGSSPFILLKDYMGNIPVYQINPNFIPEDGTGLNPLLQNYWMVIHPPTLFLGFAATLVPFAYCMAGLWQGRYKEWIRPAFPWALFAATTLGIGILMGGYWAYETLNFGGYWNWDPVENAVYVPWLVMVAAIHTMLIFKNSNKSLQASVILITAQFILILYSTFLTRSGVLGNSSVHSFTDLGLSGQLLLFLFALIIVAAILIIVRWKKLGGDDSEEVSVYSREFWIFIGVVVFCLAAFQVLYTTSIPVYNKFLGWIGIESNIAPPADQIEHYSKFQIWAGILIALISAIGQFFWWKKMDSKKLWEEISIPAIITLLVSSALICLTMMNKIDITPTYILLFTTALFSVISNISIFIKIVKNNYKLTGGAIAHIGVALMLFGILFSSGYSKVISLNTTGLIYSKEAGNDFNRDNILLWRNEWKEMNDYKLKFIGPRLEAKDFPGYIKKEHLILLDDKYKALAKKTIEHEGKKYFDKGDTIEIFPENTYYEVSIAKSNGDTFTIYPRAQVNPTMGLLASPGIEHFYDKDLYAHVSSIPSPQEEKEWSPTEEYTIKPGDTVFINDYVTILHEVERVNYVPGMPLAQEDAAVMAHFHVLDREKNHSIHPIYIIKVKEGVAGQIPDVNEDLGIKISFLNIDPTKEAFTFAVNTTQKDYIILKAIEKPFINILWIGTLVLVAGMLLAMIRRYQEFAKMRDKNTE